MKSILLIFTLILFNSLFSQKSVGGFDIHWGQEGQQIINIDSTGKIISADNAGIMALNSKYKTHSNLSVAFYKARYENIFDNCVITARYNYFPLLTLEKGKEIISVVEIDSKGKVKGGLKQVTDDNFLPKNISVDKEGLVLSNDKKLIMKLTSPGVINSSKPKQISITVMDEAFKILWKKDQEFPYTEKMMAINDAILYKFW